MHQKWGFRLRPENLRPTPKSRFHLEKWFLPTDSSFEKAKMNVWLFVNAPSRKQDALFSLLLGIANYEDLFDEGRKVIMSVHRFRSRTYLCSCFYTSKKLKASQFLKKEDALASRIFVSWNVWLSGPPKDFGGRRYLYADPSKYPADFEPIESMVNGSSFPKMSVSIMWYKRFRRVPTKRLWALNKHPKTHDEIRCLVGNKTKRTTRNSRNLQLLPT